MKKTLCLILAAMMMLSVAACAGSGPAKSDKNTSRSGPERGSVDLSSFTAEGLFGGTYSGEIFHGRKLTMLNVWGTYCGPCIREMPDLETLSKSYGADFQLVGVVIDATDRNFTLNAGKKAEAEAILSGTGVTYLQILPSQSLTDLFLSEVQVVPTTLFLDENGVILEEPYYGSRELSEWKTIVETYLEALS